MKKITILGLNSGEFNSSACIIINGIIKYATQEERLIREKFTKKFPIRSIRECLESQNLKLSDVDYVAIGWNPSLHMKKYNPILSSNRTLREYNFYTISDNLFNLDTREFGSYTKIEHDNKKFPKIYHINHHLCHAANGFYLSNFKSSAILTCDFRGELEATTFSFGNKNKIKKIESQNLPNSLGKFYSTFTELLGYKSDSDEWKVMAMSAYPYNCKEEIKKIKKTYNLKKNGKLELVSKYFEFSDSGNFNNFYSKDLLELLGIKKVEYLKKPSKKQIKIAKAMQICAEEIALHFLNHLYNLTKSKNIVLSGGFFLNSVFNGKIIKKTKFKNSYISYSPSDTGNSIGSALFLYYNILDNKKKIIPNTPFLGSNYNNSQILKILKKRNISYKKIKYLHKTVAEECSKQKIVGFFRGNLEFGDRALGCRSILADPRSKNMKDRINQSVKYRENYRPFAPSVAEESVNKFFESESDVKNEYMERVFKVKKNFTNKLPAITHLDLSARVQTVSKKLNTDFYKILREFEKITGYPILLNTSFNINGEPIVCSPDDALNTFYNSKIEILIIGDYLIKK